MEIDATGVDQRRERLRRKAGSSLEYSAHLKSSDQGNIPRMAIPRVTKQIKGGRPLGSRTTAYFGYD